MCSVVIMFAMLHSCHGNATYWTYDGKSTFVFAVSCISVFLCLLWMILFCLRSEWSQKTTPMLCGLLAILWFFAAFIGTTWVSHLISGNEYYAGWLAAFFAFEAAFQTISEFRQARGSVENMAGGLRVVVVILLASCLEVTVASKWCSGHSGQCKDRAAYAVALGAVSIIVTLCMIIYIQVKGAIQSNALKVIRILLSIWWLVGVWILTFYTCSSITGLLLAWTGPGNGYFSCWCACLASIYLAADAFGR
jgi:hypothetical protein